ncbi:hypothetical protein [Nannocystis pusilla]|uniref:hypothetical protein n=1 Tax=Nannocystis pusilla TaxID=889268 RepID=UPI003DA2061B
MQRTWLIWVVMLACEQKGGDPQGETETAASTATDATGAPDPTGGSGTGGQSSTSSSSGAPEPTTGGTASPSSGSEPTTTGVDSSEPPGDPTQVCQRFCDRFTACELDYLFDGCPCAPEQVEGVECLHHWALTAGCFEIDSCESLGSQLSPCWDDFYATQDWCLYGDDGCEIFGEAGEHVPEDSCAYTDHCIEKPSRRVFCDATSCTCEIDGVATATCPENGLCRGSITAEEHLDACCGR